MKFPLTIDREESSDIEEALLIFKSQVGFKQKIITIKRKKKKQNNKRRLKKNKKKKKQEMRRRMST